MPSLEKTLGIVTSLACGPVHAFDSQVIELELKPARAMSKKVLYSIFSTSFL